MAQRYRKIDPRFWKDEKVRQLAPLEKLIALYLFTGQSNRVGIFSFSPGEALEDIETFPKTFAKGFRKVCQTLDFGWDKGNGVLYLPTWWKYNCPENVPSMKACLSDIHEVPKTPLITTFFTNKVYLPLYLQKELDSSYEKFRSYSGSLGSNDIAPEQEQEQKTGAGAEEENYVASRRPRVSSPNGFDAFWSLHPGPKGPRQDAVRAYKEISPPPEALEALERQIRYKAACDRRKIFCPQLPHLHRWFRKRRWEDELPDIPVAQLSTAERLWMEAQQEKKEKES